MFPPARLTRSDRFSSYRAFWRTKSIHGDHADLLPSRAPQRIDALVAASLNFLSRPKAEIGEEMNLH
jgi:hypothetical protein